MSVGTILLIVLILILVGVIPVGPAPWARNWGWGPSGIVGALLVVILILFLMGRL